MEEDAAGLGVRGAGRGKAGGGGGLQHFLRCHQGPFVGLERA
jgi:hypothetical protein